MACARPSRPCDVRLHKWLAACGLGSRRKCEELIAAGLVAVDGVVITQQGCTIDPDTQVVTVRGRAVQSEPLVYVALNKPVGYLCTSRDTAGRDTFLQLLPANFPRVFSVGRLDRQSEGLLFVTNDGDWAHQVQHPRHQVTKSYWVWVSRPLSQSTMQRMLDGVDVDGERLAALAVKPVSQKRGGLRYQIDLQEGRNRHIRRLIQAVGGNVTRLRRIRIGEVVLKGLAPGQWRRLTPEEVAHFRQP